MTSEQLVEEITILDNKIADLQQQLVLADGARQAFRYILNKMSGPAPSEPTGEEQHD